MGIFNGNNGCQVFNGKNGKGNQAGVTRST